MSGLGSLALVRQPVYKKENSETKIEVKTDIVSHPAPGRGVESIYIQQI